MRGRKPAPPPAMNVIEGDFGAPPTLQEPDWRLEVVLAEWGSQAEEIASQQWKIVIDHMRAAGTLGPENAGQIELYCVNYARWKMAESIVAKVGPIIRAPKTGVMMHSPYLAVANKAAELVSKIGSDLGLTPSMRGRVTKAKRAEKAPRVSDRYLSNT